MLEAWLDPVLYTRDLKTELLQNRVCSVLEELARSLAGQYDKHLENGFPETNEMWGNVVRKIEKSFDLFKIETGHATETEFLNVAQDCDLPTLTIMKNSVRGKKNETDAIKNIFESTRFRFHYEKLARLPDAKWERRVQRYLVREMSFGSIGRAHAGFMNKTYARDFLDSLEPIQFQINGTVRLIAYFAGINAFPKLSELFTNANRNRRQTDLLQALRIIGGPDVTIMFSGLLQNRELQFTVANHLIDMASTIDIFMSDDWFIKGPKMAPPTREHLGNLQSSVDRSSRENWSAIEPEQFLMTDRQMIKTYRDIMKAQLAAKKVQRVVKRLVTANRMANDLAVELLILIERYLKNL